MEALPGRSLLVGLTYVGPDESVQSRRQFLGEVLAAAPGDPPGLYVRAPGGEVVTLPSDSAAVLPAPRGQYRCLVSGETLTDPDLLASWRITLSADAAPRWEANYAPHVRSIVPDEWDFTYRHDPAFLRHFLDSYASAYLGRRVLVVLQVYEDHTGGRLLGEEQRTGRLTRASYGEGVILTQDSGKEFRLPPDLTLLQPAPPGDYPDPRPDLITRWTVLRTPEDDDDS